MDGVLSLEGWQWMFMVEGLLAMAVGIWAYFYIETSPLMPRGSTPKKSAC
jgi:hypothetical protein